jgi:hypothetical protein
MSITFHDEFLDELFRFLTTESDDPDVKKRQELFFKLYVKHAPGAKAALKAVLEADIAEVRVAQARSLLRRVLALRKLALSAEQEARIAACTDLPTLARWLDQTLEAPSAAEALE